MKEANKETKSNIEINPLNNLRKILEIIPPLIITMDCLPNKIIEVNISEIIQQPKGRGYQIRIKCSLNKYDEQLVLNKNEPFEIRMPKKKANKLLRYIKINHLENENKYTLNIIKTAKNEIKVTGER